jgi:hypothetical protein
VEERDWCWPWSCGYDEYRESCQCCTRTARVLSTAVELCVSKAKLMLTVKNRTEFQFRMVRFQHPADFE